QCQSLVEENRKLQDALTASQIPQVVIDSVFLQTQVDTLQWQMKQIETNKQMYRSLMEEVVHFLDRARKSLDILHAKSSHKDKSLAGRVLRSRSVYAVDADSSPNRATSASPTPSTSRFARVKSSGQISYTSNLREFTLWSLFRRTDSARSTPPRKKEPQEHLNKTYDSITYKRPELDPDEVPPEKLSQEAFRLMRTVQSLLSMREPDLARVSSTETSESSPSPVDHRLDGDTHNDEVNLQNDLRDSARYDRRSSCENESNSTESSTSPKIAIVEVNENSEDLGKTAEKEVQLSNGNCCNGSTITDHDLVSSAPASTSTPYKCEKKEEEDKSTPAVSVSSVEDESGFSSMGSQEVGLLNALPISPMIKGCHTEVGLPKVPLGRNRHRKWSSSTMAEIQNLLKRQRNSLTTTKVTAESLSVWV
ncbi:hypothetical protein E2986_12526, partial [Frieseomelitta varia]